MTIVLYWFFTKTYWFICVFIILEKEITVDNIHEQIAPLNISQDDVAARPDSSYERTSPVPFNPASTPTPGKWICPVYNFFYSIF